MKKMFLLITALLGLASAAVAAPTNTPTYTPTPNATLTAAQTQIQQTQTAVAATATYIATSQPTLTPTLTPTGTISPSPTYTPAPKRLKGGNERMRVYYIPSDTTYADGVTALSNTAQPGSANPWMAQSLSQSVAVLSTGTAEIRQTVIVPWNYRGNARLFAILGAQSQGDSVTLTVGVNGQRFNDTTQTVGTFSYIAPPGGNYYLAGTAQNVMAQVYNNLNPLWSGTTASIAQPSVVSRVQLPLPANCAWYWNALPTQAVTLMPGDIVNFDIKRTSGGAGNVYLYDLEFDYEGAQGIPY